MKNGVKLNGRVLWFDGDSSFEMDYLYDYLLSGGKLDEKCFVFEESEEIEQFNAYNPPHNLSVKTEMKPINPVWDLKGKYKNMDVHTYVRKKLLEEIDANPQFDEYDIEDRMDRVEAELKLFDYYGMTDILRTVVFIVDTFRKNNVIWGTGRGSSCCCYCLYLFELHDVDSVQFDLDLTEFFRQ